MRCILRNHFNLILALCLLSGPFHSFASNYLFIENRLNGKIIHFQIDKHNYSILGRVIRSPEIPNPFAYRTSIWGKNGTVVGTSVNAIHIKLGQRNDDPFSADSQRGIILTILPKEYNRPIDDDDAFRNLGCIITNIPSGTSLFSEYSPYVGNPVFLLDTSFKLIDIDKKKADIHRHLKPLLKDYIPTLGDILVINVKPPRRTIKEIRFENKFDGQVTITYKNGKTKAVARVLKPVLGIGRFEGSQYIGHSQVRANHPGVIDISTSPNDDTTEQQIAELRGGFQIIPSVHAMDVEMRNDTMTKTQWMVVGPLNTNDSPLEGTEPLFSGYIRPGDKVQMRIDNGDWEDLPALSGKIDDAFIPIGLQRYFAEKGINRQIKYGITHFRIILR